VFLHRIETKNYPSTKHIFLDVERQRHVSVTDYIHHWAAVYTRERIYFTLTSSAFYEISGVPYKSTVVPVLVYPPEPNARNMTFILNGYPVDPKETEEMLSKVTGGRVKIQNVQPLPVRKVRSDDSGKSSDEK
jgi:hypothetical protein